MDFQWEWNSTNGVHVVDDAAAVSRGVTSFCHWHQFSVAVALSGAAGIRAALPVFLLSLLHQVDPAEFPLSDEVEWLRHGDTCVFLGVLLLVEIILDHIPAADHLLHTVLAPVHPLMGAAAAMGPHYCGGIVTRVPMAFVGAGLAGMVHSGKAGARAVGSTHSCGALNPVMSHLESWSVAFLAIFSIMSPIVALGASVVFIFVAFLGVQVIMQTLGIRFEGLAPSRLRREGRARVRQWDEETGCTEPCLQFAASAPPLDSHVSYTAQKPQKPTSAALQPANRKSGKEKPLQAVDSGSSDTSSSGSSGSSKRGAHAPSELVAVAPQLRDDCNLRSEAQREIDRVLAAPNLHWVLGGGTSAATKQEYHRLLRLLHPDRGVCSGERANRALGRVIEAHAALHGSQ